MSTQATFSFVNKIPIIFHSVELSPRPITLTPPPLPLAPKSTGRKLLLTSSMHTHSRQQSAAWLFDFFRNFICIRICLVLNWNRANKHWAMSMAICRQQPTVLGSSNGSSGSPSTYWRRFDFSFLSRIQPLQLCATCRLCFTVSALPLPLHGEFVSIESVIVKCTMRSELPKAAGAKILPTTHYSSNE